MGCGCGSSSSSSGSAKTVKATTTAPTECTYTKQQLEEWLTRVMCFKDKALWSTTNVSRKLVNRYIALLTAAINYLNNPCFYSRKLKDVENFITLLTATGQC